MTGQNGKKDKANLSGSDITVVLVDYSCTVEELRLLAQQENLLMITLDYESHKSLSGNNIQHEISDIYLNETDLDYIQKSSYSLSRWYRKPEIAKSLEYEGINLGQVLEVEFNYLLVPFLKKFVEVSKIFKKYHDSKFIAADSLYEIVSSFTDSVSKIGKPNKATKFLYDSIKFTLNIKGNFITINFSSSSYHRLKKISDKIIHMFFGPEKNFNSKKSVLLVEFDLIRYRQIFSNLPDRPLNLALFNRRRPSIWNYESFSIVRKSNCTVITNYAVNENSLENSVKIGISEVKRKINSLSAQDELFKFFFSICGISFWQAVKPLFIKLCEKRIPETIREIEITKRVLGKYSFSSILVLSEKGFNEQIIVKLAKKLGIPVILIQHGLYYDTTEASEMNEFKGIFPSEADKFIVWGKVTEQHALKSGVPSEKIEILGSPIYDNIPNFLTNSKKDFILLATSGPVKEDVHDLSVKTNEKYEETIRKICKIISKKNKKLVIKLHPSPDEIDITELAKEIDTKIRVVKTGNILPLIQSCQVLITIDVSTVILEAQILKKPVISILVKDYGWGTPTVLRSNACIGTDIDNFQSLLDRVLNDEDFKQLTVENGIRFSDEYLSCQGTASKELFDFLNKI